MINQREILEATHHGWMIYKLVLSYYHEDSPLLGLSGKRCHPFYNPFNEKKQTLIISRRGQVFYYHDTELPEFKGNPFDFAALHYQLSGVELLEKINRDLSLHLGKENEDNGKPDSIKPMFPLVIMEAPSFSFYNCPITNTRPNGQINVVELYDRIKDESDNGYKARTLELRSISDPEAASKYKRTHFDFVTASGIFSKRSNSALVCHSDLVTLDFDHVENLQLVKKTLFNDLMFDLVIDMMFDSPSGTGFKCLISIDIMRYSHQQWFETLAAYFKKWYNLEVDKSGKDVSRACFIPHDPNVWIHPLYRI